MGNVGSCSPWRMGDLQSVTQTLSTGAALNMGSVGGPRSTATVTLALTSDPWIWWLVAGSERIEDVAPSFLSLLGSLLSVMGLVENLAAVSMATVDLGQSTVTPLEVWTTGVVLQKQWPL